MVLVLLAQQGESRVNQDLLVVLALALLLQEECALSTSTEVGGDGSVCGALPHTRQLTACCLVRWGRGALLVG